MACAIASESDVIIPDVFNCIVCMDRLKDARMCQQCSKLTCHGCLLQWFSEGNRQCPHCRIDTYNENEFIICRWEKEISEQFLNLFNKLRKTEELLEEQLNKKQSVDSDGRCANHQKKITVYCNDCQMCICKDTAVWSVEHKSHNFATIEEIYQQHSETAEEELLKLRQRAADITNEMNVITLKVQSMTMAKDECLRKMTERLEQMLQTKIRFLNTEQTFLTDELTAVESAIEKVESHKREATRLAFIKKNPELFELAKTMVDKPMEALTVISPEFDFEEEILTPSVAGLFVVRKFSEHRRNGDIIYSPTLSINGVSFQLKIHANGADFSERVNRSLYVEMIVDEDHDSSTNVESELIMLQQEAPDGEAVNHRVKRFHKVFTDDRTVHGAVHFYPLDNLLNAGYLNQQNDTIIFTWKINECEEEEEESE